LIIYLYVYIALYFMNVILCVCGYLISFLFLAIWLSWSQVINKCIVIVKSVSDRTYSKQLLLYYMNRLL